MLSIVFPPGEVRLDRLIALWLFGILLGPLFVNELIGLEISGVIAALYGYGGLMAGMAVRAVLHLLEVRPLKYDPSEDPFERAKKLREEE